LSSLNNQRREGGSGDLSKSFNLYKKKNKKKKKKKKEKIKKSITKVVKKVMIEG